MAYNRWLSGRQYYQPNDVLHFGRKGMKWGKHIFGIPESLFQRIKVGPGMDEKSLQNLLRRGFIDYNTFKQLANRQNMFNQIVNRGRSGGFNSARPAESPSSESTRRSAQQIRDIGESVKRETIARSERESAARSKAEEKARMGRRDERQVQANERKTADERHAQHVSEQRAKREQKRQQEARETAQERKAETQRKREEAPKPTSKPSTSQPATQTEESSDPFATLLADYITDMANETEEERAKRKEEERKAKEAEERKKKEEEERKKKEKLKRDVEILKKINRVLSFGHMPISP